MTKTETTSLPTVTPMEAQALNLMAYDLYNQSNGSRPTEFNDVGGGVWTWSVADCWPHKRLAFSGVMSSLVQKGLAWSAPDSNAGTGRRRHRDEPSDAAIGMTELGFKVWQTVDSGAAGDGRVRPEAPKAEPEPVAPTKLVARQVENARIQNAIANPNHKTYAVYADRVVVAKVSAKSWLAAMELAESKIGPSVTAVRLVRK